MQCWKPEDPREFTGDMMLFWDHHAERAGLGGHSWAHASTADLREWTHHPLAKAPRRLPDIILDAANGYAAASVPGVSVDSTLTVRFTCEPGISEYGLLLRADADISTGYRLTTTPREDRVTLRRWPGGGALRAEIAGLEGLDRGVEIVVCQSGSVLDFCVAGRHTAAERVFDFAGTSLVVFARAGALAAKAWMGESAEQICARSNGR